MEHDLLGLLRGPLAAPPAEEAAAPPLAEHNCLVVGAPVAPAPLDQDVAAPAHLALVAACVSAPAQRVVQALPDRASRSDADQRNWSHSMHLGKRVRKAHRRAEQAEDLAEAACEAAQAMAPGIVPVLKDLTAI